MNGTEASVLAHTSPLASGKSVRRAGMPRNEHLPLVGQRVEQLMAVTTTQASHERGNVLAGQACHEAGTCRPMTSAAEVEGAVNTGSAAHVQPLSHKTCVTPEGSSVPLSPAAAGIQAAPCTPPCPTPCTCAIEAAVDSVALHFGLSEREHTLLMLLAEGLTAQQAADRLTVSRNTVKSHMAHIYVKCNVRTRAELNELLEAAGRL